MKFDSQILKYLHQPLQDFAVTDNSVQQLPIFTTNYVKSLDIYHVLCNHFVT